MTPLWPPLFLAATLAAPNIHTIQTSPQAGNALTEDHGRDQIPAFTPSPADQARIKTYYAEEFRRGNCPPGLAKQNTTCLPPAQPRTWSAGRTLPADAETYPLPAPLLAQLTPPPTGTTYIRIAADILLITTRTRTVTLTVADLTR